MNARLVNKEEELLYHGDILPVKGEEKYNLIIVCPGCGEKILPTDRYTYYPQHQSYRPAIFHKEGCGWVGLLTNGVFRKSE